MNTITITEKKFTYVNYANAYRPVKIDNPRKEEINVTSFCELIEAMPEYSLVDDIPEKELKLKRGGFLIVINDKVLYKNNKPFYRPSKTAAEDTVKTLITRDFLKTLDIDFICKMYNSSTYAPTNARTGLFMDMISNDFVEIFKKG